MRRADRLFQIVQYLRNRRLTTAQWLADKLEVSQRTIYRDIQDLSLSGVPIEGEAGLGYVLRLGFDIPPLMFTKDEIEALVIAARMAKGFGGEQLARSTDQALAKIEAVLPDALKIELSKPRLYTPNVLLDDPTNQRLDELRLSINKKCLIAIDYVSLQHQVSQRTVRPLGLFFWGKIWTLAAWCELRQDYRSFRVDRIKSMQEMASFFVEDEVVSFTRFLNLHYGGADHSALL